MKNKILVGSKWTKDEREQVVDKINRKISDLNTKIEGNDSLLNEEIMELLTERDKLGDTRHLILHGSSQFLEGHRKNISEFIEN